MNASCVGRLQYLGTLWICAVLFLGPSIAQGEIFTPFVDPLGARPPELDQGLAVLPQDAKALDCEPATYRLLDMARPLRLEQIVDIALCNNPQLQYTWAGIKVQAANLGSARAAYWPTLNLSVSQMNDVTQFPGSRQSTSRIDTTSASATINWRIWDFGEGRAASESAEATMLAAAIASHDATLQKTLSTVISAYFDAQTALANLEARKSQEELAQLTLQAVQRRLERGAGAQSDALQAATALAKAKLERNRSAGALNKARSVLVYAMGLPAQAELRLAQQPWTVNTSSEAAWHSDVRDKLQSWLDLAQLSHPAIQAARLQTRAAKDKLQATRAEGMPSLDLSANYYDNGRPNQSLSASQTQETLAGVTLTIPVFSGFGNTYKVRSAQAQLQQAQANLIDTEQQVLTELVKNHADATAALDNLEAADALLDAATASIETVQRKFDKGAADILEMLTTQSAMAEAQLERVRGQAEWQSAKLRLLAAAGILGRDAIAH